jgi:hypothetical protein
MSQELLNNTVKQTVNVVMVDKKSFSPSIIGTFEDNSAGNIFAEELFIKTCKTQNSIAFENFDSLDIEFLLDDSYFETDKVQICITHSLNEFDNTQLV